MQAVASLFLVSAFADSMTDRETWREFPTHHPSVVFDEEAGGIDDEATTPRATAQLRRPRLAWTDEEEDDDEEYLIRKAENRWLARKAAFALTWFLFTAVMLPILVSHGIVRIT